MTASKVKVLTPVDYLLPVVKRWIQLVTVGLTKRCVDYARCLVNEIHSEP